MFNGEAENQDDIMDELIWRANLEEEERQQEDEADYLDMLHE